MEQEQPSRVGRRLAAIVAADVAVGVAQIQVPDEALEEAKLAARRDPRLFLPPVLETLAHVALGQIDAAKISLISARRLRPELTLREIEISHGRRAVKALAGLWTEAS